MKKVGTLLCAILITLGCQPKKTDIIALKKEIFQIEKDFENECRQNGLAAGFYKYAHTNAVLKRENDTLIKGRKNIKQYYSNSKYDSVSLTWTPDTIEISEDGKMASTYGNYLFLIKKDSTHLEFKGVFHTVWVKDENNNWKYIWD